MYKDREECKKCALYSCKYVPMQHIANPSPNILVVGQAPGHIETLTKVPFTGPAGKMLWSLLNSANINKSIINLSNSVHCAPPEDRMPSSKEQELCFEHLKEEILLCKPQLIIATGEAPLYALTGLTGIMSQRGRVLPLLNKYEYECKVLCVLHPSFVMRQRQYVPMAIQDLSKTYNILSGINNPDSSTTIIASYEKPEFILDPSASELSYYLEEMSNGITAVDIETPAQLDILTARVIGIAFASSDKKAATLDLSEKDKGTERWMVMERFLADAKARKCTQNGQFDKGVLESNGVVVNGLVYDTLLAEHTMNSDLPGNLDSLRSRYTDIAPYKPGKKAMKTIQAWDTKDRMIYNCWDVIATWAVMEGQKKVMNPKQLNVLESIEIPLIDVCNYMEKKGIKVDVPVLALTYAKIQPVVDRLEKELLEATGGVNPRSPVMLKKFFNLDSTDEKTLTEQIKRGHKQAEIMQKVLDYRDVFKSSSVYLKGVYDRLRSGRIHAHPKIEGTGTGRLSYKNPNLQNVPKYIRHIYIPDDDNHLILEADYSQLEVRVVANVANEKTMLDEMANGIVAHHTMGRIIYGKEWAELTDKEQLKTKTIVFGTAYGRRARSIAIEYGIPVKQAEEWQQACIKKYPGLLDYVSKMENTFNRFHKCETVFGRTRFLQTVTQAFNTPIQSAGSDIMLTSLIELFKKGYDLRITVHDSVIIHLAKEGIKDQAEEIKKILSRPIAQLNNYSFPCKVKVGKNWRELEEV